MTTPEIKYPKKYPVLGLMFDFRRSQRNNDNRVSRWLWLYLEFIANALNYSLFSLPLHYRFACGGAYIAETENGGAIGDHGNKIPLVGIFPHPARVILYFKAWVGHSW